MGYSLERSALKAELDNLSTQLTQQKAEREKADSTVGVSTYCSVFTHTHGMMDLRSIGRGFESQPPRCRVQPGQFVNHMCLCHQAV